MALRVTTWNLQGRARPDLAAVADVLGELGADVILLQEVQRRQARQLAGRLGWTGVAWRFKHWPVVLPAEGLAVLTRHRADAARARALARRWTWWSSHRRIAVAADLDGPLGPLRVVSTHLGAGVGDAERSRQAALVVDLAGTGLPSVIGGDLNADPRSAVLDRLGVAGHREAWTACRADAGAPTNWAPGPRDGAPTQRLDYLFVDPDLEILDVTVPRFGEPGFDRFGPISDHLPVTATLAGPAA